MKKVFVTVGTTKFEKLIEELSKDELLDILYSLGYTLVQFQVGSGAYKRNEEHSKIQVKYHPYFENFDEEIASADLVISHAGAGTCLEVLKKQKPLIVVTNEDLMDNHQTELAEELARQGYLKCCTPTSLKSVLQEDKFGDVKTYPKTNPASFSRYLDKCMGFETNLM
jgi:beta-1,4-N-acetylglucosaminyltransferase